MIRVFFFSFMLAIVSHLQAQQNVGIGTITPNSKALLDLTANDKGILIPRLTSVERLAISPVGNADEALLVFDTDLNLFFYWDGAQWIGFPITAIPDYNTSLIFDPISGLLSLTDGGGTLSTSFPPDSDSDPNNEIQSLALNGQTLSISNGNSVTLIDNVNDADADPNNEIQSLALNGQTLSISNGNSVTLIDNVNDADADPNNEIQSLALNGQTLSISNGNSVTLIDNVNDADADPANELQTYSAIRNGVNVNWNLTNGGNGSFSIDDFDWSGQGSGTMYPFTITDRVGIATTSPASALAVAGNLTIGASWAGNTAAQANGLLIEGNTRVGTISYPSNIFGGADAANYKVAITGGFLVVGGYNTDPGVGGFDGPGTNFIGGVGALAVGMNRTGGYSDVDFWNTTQHTPPNTIAGQFGGFRFRKYDNTGLNEVLLAYVRGDGQCFSNGWNIFSDARFKTNVTSLQSSISAVMKLNPVTYDWQGFHYNEQGNIIPNQSLVSYHKIGLLAQQVNEVLPELVTKPNDETKEFWAVDYVSLSVLLLKALQEQQVLIEQQQIRIQKLESAVGL